ncbi:MAG: thiamine pyrophosphate-dependent dehydrogenase E1 component subunit alpha [Gaiellales bacterium]
MLLDLYRQMARARAFELALAELWHDGLVSGELHLGTGEEAIAAGVICQLGAEDALALDHRSTPPLVARGVDLAAILREVLGRENGLCGGRGGHMHLLSRPDRSASSGIVGSSAPLGAGFALAAKLLSPGSAAVAFFGEGAANQGVVLETLNLASVWNLPLLHVCKDNGWAITTRSQAVTAGDLVERAASFGLPVHRVDGRDVREVWKATEVALERARAGAGPSFLLATCPRPDGHFLGDPMVRTARSPVGEGRRSFARITAAALSPRGSGLRTRVTSVSHLIGLLGQVRATGRGADDPLQRARQALEVSAPDVERIDKEVAEEIADVVATVLTEGAPS